MRLRKRCIPILVCAWTLSVTVARALRLPNDFAEAHWLLDYRFGFMKRGLVGSVCSLLLSPLGYQMTPGIITALSALTLLGFLAGLLVLLRRLAGPDAMRAETVTMGLVFASSPLLVMAGHLFGYFDALLYVFALAAVALTLLDRPFAAAIVSIAAMLTHEGYLLTGFPLVCLASVALVASRRRQVQWQRHLLAHCIPVLTFVAIPVLQSLSTDHVALRGQLEDHLNTFGFVGSRSVGVARWQTTSFLEFLYAEARGAFERLLSPAILAQIGPPLVAVLYFTFSSFRLRSSGLLSLALLGSVGAPLALLIVAWDTERIWTYPIGSAFIAWWILAETRKARPVNHCALFALPALLLNVFGRTQLMDGMSERFTALERLLLYAPTLAFALSCAARSVAPRFVARVRRYWLSNSPIRMHHR
jgi:hypothetical protein